MERVEFQQEQMLAELTDLVERNLFTEKETKMILKKRTAFETALVRRVAKKADFLRYAAYERALEDLRRKRVERMRTERGPMSISDYAIVQRQFNILERALRKFKGDVGLWIQYIELAKKERAKALVGRITARALQMHPNEPSLYILAAAHELSHNSPSSARTLLQRGLRINKESVALWTEYVKMELGWVESLRRRWGVLGINETGKEDEDEESKSRREVMEGAIVKSVISNATEALPKIELYSALEEMILHYPTTEELKETLLSHLDAMLRCSLNRIGKKGKGKGILILANRYLLPEAKGNELVEGLKKANDELVEWCMGSDGEEEEYCMAYAEFVNEWCGSLIDENLKLYLVCSLQGLIHRRSKTSPALLSTHLRVAGKHLEPGKVLKLARKYTAQAPESGKVWIARFMVENEITGEVTSGREGLHAVSGKMEETEEVERWLGRDGDHEESY